MASILDKNFRYVKREATDISKTFARVRREMKAAEDASKPKPAPQSAVPALRRVGGGKS